MLRYLFNFSQTEYVLLLLLILAGGFLLLFGLLKRKHNPIASKTSGSKNDPSSKEGKGKSKDPALQVMEIFDYNGTKILHQDGAYTVNDKGVVTNYSNWNLLPRNYQAMVKELDKRSLGEKGQDYFLEMINGFYYVSQPGGKKKRYDSISDIPPDIRKKLGV
ncbi:hypothetical protein [Leptospira idonii]|uniref:Uncharacterized protein n=1 Tax=Leptospira idonii TaxID=1193500 RepID=A0A4R9M190_9LEPT|nr:hypothetical protein [Leptospira idonii]TGN20463.1 hypothetical protein EHS15_04450 [Leptospira idonii]